VAQYFEQKQRFIPKEKIKPYYPRMAPHCAILAKK